MINKILKKKFKFTLLLFFLIIGSIIFYNTFLKVFLGENRHFIKKYFFPYEHISKLENMVLEHYALDYYFKISNKNITVGKMQSIKLSNNRILDRYALLNGFHLGIYNSYPGSGFIDFHRENLIILSSRGVLGYSDDFVNQLIFKQIPNNIDQFIGVKEFLKTRAFSVKDLLIHNKKIYVSYNEEIKNDCWNTSLIVAEFNYENIEFQKLFSAQDCIHEYLNRDKEFHPHSAGGRIVSIDSENVVLSIGEYRERYLAQEKLSVNGKLVKININNSTYEIISMGHRNPQGLYYDKDNDFIIATEHGPMGGDEINLIKINHKYQEKILNYGWPIVSAGEHYGGKISKNKKKYELYPLYKSHIEHGFIPPLKSFVPSIGISEINKIKNNKYVVSSLKDKSLYFFELSENKEIINIKRVEVFERIRDLKFKDDKLYFFLEDTPSIGIIYF